MNAQIHFFNSLELAWIPVAISAYDPASRAREHFPFFLDFSGLWFAVSFPAHTGAAHVKINNQPTNQPTKESKR